MDNPSPWGAGDSREKQDLDDFKKTVMKIRDQFEEYIGKYKTNEEAKNGILITGALLVATLSKGWGKSPEETAKILTEGAGLLLRISDTAKAKRDGD